jgi:hypothetical protein
LFNPWRGALSSILEGGGGCRGNYLIHGGAPSPPYWRGGGQEPEEGLLLFFT